MIVTSVVNQFDGGMVLDPRDPRQNVARTVQHFDAFTNKYKLTPFVSPEDGDSSSTANQIANFAYNGTTLYGLAVSGGTGPAAVLTRTTFTGAVWGTTNGTSNIGGSNRTDADTPFFVYYKKTASLYGVRGARYVWSIAETGGSANTSERDLTAYTTVSNGIVHSKDDVLYFGYDNKVASNNNGSWTTPALTLPAGLIITSICEYGNYLAIGCRPSGGGNSRVFLWDRDASLATVSESIDWGEGNLTVLEELEGSLIGVSFEGTTGSYNLKSRVVARYYSGSQGAVKFAEFVGFNQSPTVTSALFKFKGHNRILFPASIPIGTTGYFGVWSIGRSSTGVPFAMTLDRIFRTAYGGGLSFYGLTQLGDYQFSAYLVNSVAYLDKTDDASTYTTTSVYETTINPGMLPQYKKSKKQLLTVAVSYEPLPTAGQVVLQYRVDGGAWATIFTEATDNQVTTEMVSTGVPGGITSGREYEFRVQSTGGAELTEIKYNCEILKTLI